MYIYIYICVIYVIYIYIYICARKILTLFGLGPSVLKVRAYVRRLLSRTDFRRAYPCFGMASAMPTIDLPGVFVCVCVCAGRIKTHIALFYFLTTQRTRNMFPELATSELQGF